MIYCFRVSYTRKEASYSLHLFIYMEGKQTLYFVERRLNQARIDHLTRLATKNELFDVVQDVEKATILVAQDSLGEEVVDFLSKKRKISHDVIRKRTLVDISWFIRCMREKKVLEVNNCDILSYKDENQDKDEDASSPAKKMREAVDADLAVKLQSTEKTVSMYACQNLTPLNHCNKRFTDALEILEQHALFRGDANSNARALAFRRGSAALKPHPEVTGVMDLNNMPYIGLKNSSKAGHCKKIILEILNEGFSDEVESVLDSEFFKAMKLFTGIFGVGTQTARKWYYDLELRRLDDLSSKSVSLTREQKLGLEHYTDINTPLKIAEAKYIMKLVEAACCEVSEKLTVTLVGGFRRGKSEGHDLDLLISHPEPGKEKYVLPLIMEKLDEHFIYTGRKMTASKRNEERGDYTSTMDNFDKCFSIFKFQKNWIPVADVKSDKDWKAVRVDLIVVPVDQFAFALLGWTGTKHFEREIRRYARAEKNLILTSHALHSASTKESFPAKTEEEIFHKLGLIYREPSERCC